MEKTDVFEGFTVFAIYSSIFRLYNPMLATTGRGDPGGESRLGKYGKYSEFSGSEIMIKQMTIT